MNWNVRTTPHSLKKKRLHVVRLSLFGSGERQLSSSEQYRQYSTSEAAKKLGSHLNLSSPPACLDPSIDSSSSLLGKDFKFSKWGLWLVTWAVYGG